MEEASIDESAVYGHDRSLLNVSGLLPDLVLPAEDADTRPGPSDLSILMRNVGALAPRARSSPRIANRSTIGLHGQDLLHPVVARQRVAIARRLY
jgi:hypothetical protein